MAVKQPQVVKMETKNGGHCALVNWILKILRSFKLLNWRNEVSLTNIAFYIVLYKLAITDMSETSIGEIATALSVMGLYFGKKLINKNRPMEMPPEDDEDEEGGEAP